MCLVRKMKRVMFSDIMTNRPITILHETNLLECAKIMVRKRVGSLIITDAEKNLRGFISRRDILWALIKKSKEDLGKIKAIEVSPKKIAFIRSDATINEAIEKIKTLKFERLPVVSGREVVGILTVKDILNFHPEFYSELDEFAKIRDESEKLKRVKEKEFSRSEDSCERCGQKKILKDFNGMQICEDCANSL